MLPRHHSNPRPPAKGLPAQTMDTTTVFLARSVLYVPGSNPRALAKASTLGADALILDLEDSVAPGAKAEARHAIRHLLDQRAIPRPRLTVRINGPTTSAWRDDLEITLPGRPDAMVLPKVESLAEVEEVAAAMAALEDRLKLEAPTPLWAMIESPLGVLHAPAIAGHPRVVALVMGTSDLGKALRVRPAPGRPALQTALQSVVLAARAENIAVLDGVFLDLKDGEGFATQCREGAAMGFDGKTIIHPAQIEPANRAFLPTPDERADAVRILDAWRAAADRGEEICLLDGRLVERLHAQEAERIVTLCNIVENQ